MTLATQSRTAELMAALREPAGQHDPYPIYRELRALGPVSALPDGSVVVSGYRECAELLRTPHLKKNPGALLEASGYADWRARSSLRLMFDSLLMLNPPSHTRLRRLVAGAFGVRRVAGLRRAVEEIVDGALADMDGDVDFVDTFAFPVPVAVIGELLGVPASDRPMFRALVHDWTLVLERLDVDAVQRADAAATTITTYLGELADERRANPSDDLISALVAAEEDGDRLTHEELVTTAALLLGAGFETTTGLFANALVALLDTPDQATLLREAPDIANRAADELLRFDTPVQILFGRTTAEAMTIAGTHLERGTRVLTVLGSANRDPSIFARPDRLDIGRGGESVLSFGGGIHHCLGAPLARLETEVALPALLRRFPNLRRAGEGVRRQGITLRGYSSLPISVW